MRMGYIINLFGTGIRYWNCEVAQEVFDDMNRIRGKNQVAWEQVLFDLDFLNHYGFGHWSELAKSSDQTSTPACRNLQRGRELVQNRGFLLELAKQRETRSFEVRVSVFFFPIQIVNWTIYSVSYFSFSRV